MTSVRLSLGLGETEDFLPRHADGLIAGWTDVRHAVLEKVVADPSTGSLAKLLLRLFAECSADDFECWCDETGRDADMLRAQVGARYRFSPG